jgi:hypothetical protein
MQPDESDICVQAYIRSVALVCTLEAKGLISSNEFFVCTNCGYVQKVCEPHSCLTIV